MINRSTNWQYYFNIVSSNGQILCTSGTYTTKQSAEGTIQSIKDYANGAAIVDNT